MCVTTIPVVTTSSSPTAAGELARLPAVFSYAEASASGMSDRKLYGLVRSGLLVSLGRGLFHQADATGEADPDLLEIAHRASRATLCLTSALARHGLTDEIPPSIDIALPRGQRHPRTQAPVAWHSFAPGTFDLGRDELQLTGTTTIGLYNPVRCIVDAFRLRHLEGPEPAVEALRRWLRRRGSSPATLMAMARSFPKAEPSLRNALEILL